MAHLSIIYHIGFEHTILQQQDHSSLLNEYAISTPSIVTFTGFYIRLLRPKV
jgi:hypothetical protein